MARGRTSTGVLLTVIGALTVGLLISPPAAASGPPVSVAGWTATALPTSGHVVTGKADRTSTAARVARLSSPSALAAEGPEGVPDVAPGPTPAGYLPLDQFGIAPSPIGDEEFINFDTRPFLFANRTYTSVAVNSNGYVKAGAATSEDNNCCDLPAGPSPAPPNAIIAPFWTDLDGTGAPGIFAGLLTDGVQSWFVIEWRVNVFGTPSQRVFQVWLGLDGAEDVTMVYPPSNRPTQPGGQEFLVGAENSVGQGDVARFVPSEDLRVTSAVPVVAASVQPVSGGGQSAESGQPFANPLVTAVTGTDGEPFVGGTVTYTVTSGTASFGGSATATATTDAAGRATSPVLTAGSTAGPVTVSASAPYATSATFALTVTRTAAAITAVSGGGQSTPVNRPFAQPLVAVVAATDRQPLAGAPVTFRVTSGRASFNGSATATVATGSDGRATSPTLTAGTSTGAVTVTATTPGVSQSASYSLTVTPASADLSATLTGPTSAVRPGARFTVTLVVRNAGPSPATAIGSGIALPAQTRIVDGGGGAVSRDGRAVAFVRSGLAAGQSVTYSVGVVADGANGQRTLTAATASAQVRDPATANNAARTTVTVRR